MATDLATQQAQAAAAALSAEQDLGIRPQGVTPASALAAASKTHGGKGKKEPSFLLKKVVGDLNVAELLFGTLGIGAAVGGYFYYRKHHHGRR